MNTHDMKLPSLLAEIGKAMYACTEEVPEDEKWNIAVKLRSRSSDAIASGAEALGSIDPRDIKWALGKTRAALFTVEATYKHACNIDILTLNPDIMVHLQRAIKIVDTLIAEATASIPEWFSEMSPAAEGDKK